MPNPDAVTGRTLRSGDTVQLRYRLLGKPELPLEMAGLDREEHETRFRMDCDPAPLPGLERALVGLAPGQTRHVDIPPGQAFGERRPELVFEAVRDNLPADVELVPGRPLYTGDPSGQRAWQLRVVERTERGAVLDGNHPLAGHTLRVEATVVSIEAVD